MHYENKIAALAETFPTLQGAPLRPWDARAFEKWAFEQHGSGLRHAAQFVLAVWSVNEPWKIGRFEVFAAMGAWDTAHHQAFVAWSSSPWTR
jgi:hypothetical protein